MFDSFDRQKLDQLKQENEYFYNLAVQILNNKNSEVTPFSVKEIMLELETLCEEDNIKELLNSDDMDHQAYIMLQTGDVTPEDIKVLIDYGLINKDSLKKDLGETKMFPKKESLDLKAPILSIKDQELEERLAMLVKSGVYSRIEVQKMIDNGLVDKEKLNDYLELQGMERSSKKNLASAFEPIMSFDGVRLSNDLVIGGSSEKPEKADEMANKQIYIF